MAVPGRDLSPTRHAALELQEEYHLVRQGYEFLDEKRMLLAAEILADLAKHQEALKRFRAQQDLAAGSLVEALRRHGLEGLSVYPAEDLSPSSLLQSAESFLGVTLFNAKIDMKTADPPKDAVHPSPEARSCSQLFRDLIAQSVEIGILAANLQRLKREYRRTERRARALENVLLPEIEQGKRWINDQLEAFEQEEAVRVRRAGRLRRS